MNDPFQLNILDPGSTRFFRSNGGMLAMSAGGILHPEVTLHRTFPFAHPDRYFSVRNAKGEELGILETLDGWDEESRREVGLELKLSYLTPQVTRIMKIRQTPGMWIWELETTMGSMRLAMRNLHEHLQNPVPGRLLLTDLEGNRVEIINFRELDAHSRKQLRKIL
jgi:hypothetical protein